MRFCGDFRALQELARRDQGGQAHRAARELLDGVEGEEIRFKDNKAGDVAIPFALVGEAKLILTDALISATMPLSSEGADEFDTEE
jgi:ribosome maturation factor RimP